ncbi:hypothetical protein HK097_007233 [Rhizophlyctis rosea]|uniref:Uncharacterized protein n=1 Tax=Rhizophlyctis rosea TaxID=64517 RepID=A0AAD5X4Q9_9FUNG|nr:hypothetical protein HK097_007233 [Rhizophlyctis rosea]
MVHHHHSRPNSLYLSNNELAELPRQMQSFNTLAHLDISFNSLTELPYVHHSTDQLQTLDARSNSIVGLPGELAACINLKKLLLFKNMLSDLPEDLFQSLPHLRILDVSSNVLTSVPTSIFNFCTELRELRLADNRIDSLPKDIANLEKVTRLILGNNRIQSIPVEMNNLTSLVELDLSGNLLNHIPDQAFLHLNHLKVLSLANNQLQSLPNFGSLADLEVLDIRKNPLTVLHVSIAKLLALEDLRLDTHKHSTITIPPLAVCQRGKAVIMSYLTDLLKGVPEPAACEAYGPGLEPSGVVASEHTFTIQSFDKYGNPKTVGGDVFIVQISVTKSDATSQQWEAVPKDLGDGTYTVTYDARESGTYTIKVSNQNENISRSPFRRSLAPGMVSAFHCTCEGEDLVRGQAGRVGTFLIKARDEYRNLLGTTALRFQVIMSLSEGIGSTVNVDRLKWSVTDNGDGTYTGSYSTPISGTYKLDVTLDGRSVCGSPFHVDVEPGETVASGCTASLTGLGNVEVGVVSSFVVMARDRFGNGRTKGGDLFATLLIGPDGGNVESEVIDNGNGEYFVRYTPHQAGPHRVEVKLITSKGTGRSIAGAPFLVKVEDAKDAILHRQHMENVKLANDLAQLNKKFAEAQAKLAQNEEELKAREDEIEERAVKESGGTTSPVRRTSGHMLGSRESSQRSLDRDLQLYTYDPQNESTVINGLLGLKPHVQPVPFHILGLCILELMREGRGEDVKGLVWNCVAGVRKILFSEVCLIMLPFVHASRDIYND